MLASISNFHSIPSIPFNGAAPSKVSSEVDESAENQLKDKHLVDHDLKVSSKHEVEQVNKEDQVIIQKLKQRDLEVKAHEQAHLSAAGNIASGGASFSFTVGPNGVRYATGGEVGIDTSPIEGDPRATLRKADTIRRAALAPASPSSQDQLVAARATAMSNKAQADLSEQIQEQQNVSKETKTEQANHSVNKSSSDARSDSDAMKGSIFDVSI